MQNHIFFPGEVEGLKSAATLRSLGDRGYSRTRNVNYAYCTPLDGATLFAVLHLADIRSSTQVNMAGGICPRYVYVMK